MDALRASVTGQAAVLSELVAAYLEKALRNSGLSLGAFELLSAVKASPAAPQAELSEKLGITPSSLSEAVAVAVRKGLVEQESSERDRRAKRVVLTRRGDRALESAMSALAEADRLALEGIPPARSAQAAEVLREASRRLSQALTG